MGSVNKAIIVGNLGSDAVVRAIPAGKYVANFSVATSSWNSSKQEEQTEWHRVVLWNRRRRPDEKEEPPPPEWWGYLLKGRQVYVEGRIQSSKWEDKEGNERSKTEIISDNQRVVLTGRRDGPDRVASNPGPSASSGPAPGPPVLTEDDIPF